MDFWTNPNPVKSHKQPAAINNHRFSITIRRGATVDVQRSLSWLCCCFAQKWCKIRETSTSVMWVLQNKSTSLYMLSTQQTGRHLSVVATAHCPLCKYGLLMSDRETYWFQSVKNIFLLCELFGYLSARFPYKLKVSHPSEPMVKCKETY